MTRRSLARSFLLSAAALLLAACGVGARLAYDNVAMMYDNAPPMLTWMVDDYVDMSGTQKEWVRERFARTLAWHRTTELPEYRRLLEGIAQKAAEPFRAAELADVHRELRRYYHRTAEQLLPHIADFLLQLEADQVAQLEKKLAESNRKVERERPRRSPEEALRRRTERAFMHVEEFTGRLSPGQRRLVVEHMQRQPDLTEMRIAERRARQAATLALIRARPGREEYIAGLRSIIIEAEAARRPEYREALERRQAQTISMLAALSETLTPAQREHLQQRLRGYARDITTLAAAT